ncbi:Cytochrome c553 [Solimicrobium silvestre]|uniref:Cytochrome c553 n=2 Tax=Solimicrobium silvestre TaxID=2099400 RepID=A0A2S9GYX2_9BURK|nr:cytochrome c [Solimicrobium silvestre]PRC92932.1 Cytochrome c553 [Solimicrobium silvestre]
MSMTVAANSWAGGDIDAGKAAVEKFGCAACHGVDFKTPIDPTYPKLAGQHQDYLTHALVAYQRGSEVANGRVNAIMNGQAKALSAKDIENITAYIHSLPGSLVLRK